MLDKLDTVYDLVYELQDALIQVVATRDQGGILQRAAKINAEKALMKIEDFLTFDP